MSTVITTQRLHELFKHLPPPPDYAGEIRMMVVPETNARGVIPTPDELYSAIMHTNVVIESVRVSEGGKSKVVWAVRDVKVTESPRTELIDRHTICGIAYLARKVVEIHPKAVHLGPNFVCTDSPALASVLRLLAKHELFSIEVDTNSGVTGYWKP